MKKWILILMASLSLQLLSGQEIGKFTAERNYKVEGTNLEFKVFVSKDYDFIIETDKNNDIEIRMNKNQAFELKNNLLKGVEWMRKADSANIEVEKEIASPMNASSRFKYGSYHTGDGYIMLKYVRKTLESGIKYNYIMFSSYGYALNNRYIKSNGMLMLTSNNAKQLADLITEENINKAKMQLAELKNKQDDLLK